MPLLRPTRLLISEKTSHLCTSRFIRAPRLLGTPEYSVDPFILFAKVSRPFVYSLPSIYVYSGLYSRLPRPLQCRGNLGGMKSREGSTFERWIKIKYLIKIDQKINLTFSPDRRDHIFVHWNTGLMVALIGPFLGSNQFCEWALIPPFLKSFFLTLTFQFPASFLFFQSDQS